MCFNGILPPLERWERSAVPGREMLFLGGGLSCWRLVSPSWAAQSLLAGSPHITQAGTAPLRLRSGFILVLTCCGVTCRAPQGR